MACAIIGLFIWTLLGIIVLTTIDDENESLGKWTDSAPAEWLKICVIWAWPVILYFWYKKEGKDECTKNSSMD
jgi:hypothetical protein